MRFGSVCSGIEAASVAWHELGWRAAWLAEIEPFPSAVLANHYPDVPNLGDMTTIATKVLTGEVEAPDILVGGTPCQAFSVAGMREGLNDPRGQLTIKYVELADAIDHVRAGRGEQPAIIAWENVPGVLSDKGNAFGCFLGALAGEDCELEAPGGKWANAGCVFGPTRTIAWRVLDAQYFGVAQRRRRVFLVASARKDIHPAQILFEFDGLRRDSAPSRESREEVAGTLEASAGRSRGAGTNPSICTEVAHSLLAKAQSSHRADSDNYVATFDRQSTGEYGTAPVASTIAARDYKSASDLILSVHGTQDPDINVDQAHTLGQENAVFGFSEELNVLRDLQPTIQRGGDGGRHEGVAYGIHGNWIGRAPENGGNAVEPVLEVAPCQTVTDRHGVANGMAVRRLTPVECERLQGFPDGYTAIPWRGKPAEDCPDGGRYKALGNSMAVPCMRFVGKRIAYFVSIAAGNDNQKYSAEVAA